MSHIAVIDIGKTNAKLALVNSVGLHEITVITQPNRVVDSPPWPHFDLAGIWAFIQNGLAQFQKQYGIDVSFGGTRADEQATMRDMMIGLVLALTLIYIILAWVFASYTWPLAVMFTIPFGLTGAILGHSVMGLDLTILSIFGLFGLSGIVINNSIVLLSFYKENRENGMEPVEAIVEAACQRLRAVILTSSTTIAGLTPMLFETSMQAKFLIPMATSIVFGLALGTLLILFVVPSIIIMLENAGNAVSNLFKTDKAAAN